MKTRIASSIALAAALVLGGSGCSMLAPQGTLEPYAPSDGIDASVSGVDVRNLLLVADEEGEAFNVVFTGVNTTDRAVALRMSFLSAGAEVASAIFEIEPGTTLFGEPTGDPEPVLVAIPDLLPGSMITTYLQASGAAEVERAVPVLDGTLPEYRSFVLPAGALERAADRAATSSSGGAKKDGAPSTAPGGSGGSGDTDGPVAPAEGSGE